MSVHSPERGRVRHLVGGFAVVLPCWLCLPTPLEGQERWHRIESLSDAHIEKTVYEGVGFASVTFGDSAEHVEEILGEAKGGSAYTLRYMGSAMEVRLRDGKVCGFSFYRGFRGSLFRSGLGVGDSVAAVEEAYGEAHNVRHVDELTDWTLDRTLLIRRGGPKYEGGPASKLRYPDVGMCFFFDSDDRVRGFWMFRKTGYADRDPEAARVEGHAQEEDTFEDLYLEDPVHEGVGFGGVEFGDTAERVESVLGEAEGGCEHGLRYLNGGVRVVLRDAKVSGFCFRKGFRGVLSTSGLGIGDSLEDAVEAYGQILKEREVDDLCDWDLDRTLLIRRGGPKCPKAPASKLHYYDAGIRFDFDLDDRIIGFGMLDKAAAAATQE